MEKVMRNHHPVHAVRGSSEKERPGQRVHSPEEGQKSADSNSRTSHKSRLYCRAGALQQEQGARTGQFPLAAVLPSRSTIPRGNPPEQWTDGHSVLPRLAYELQPSATLASSYKPALVC